MRQTMKEIEVNVAYRWFLGLDMLDPVPHFSTFGKNYTRRFYPETQLHMVYEPELQPQPQQGRIAGRRQLDPGQGRRRTYHRSRPRHGGTPDRFGLGIRLRRHLPAIRLRRAGQPERGRAVVRGNHREAGRHEVQGHRGQRI